MTTKSTHTSGLQQIEELMQTLSELVSSSMVGSIPVPLSAPLSRLSAADLATLDPYDSQHLRRSKPKIDSGRMAAKPRPPYDLYPAAPEPEDDSEDALLSRSSSCPEKTWGVPPLSDCLALDGLSPVGVLPDEAFVTPRLTPEQLASGSTSRRSKRTRPRGAKAK